MKNRQSVFLIAFKIILFCMVALLSLSSCSKQSGINETTPKPAETKMEGQSGNWKVMVVSVKPIPKNPFPDRDRPDSKYDLLEVALDVEFVGSSGNIPMLKALLIDDKGQKFGSLITSVAAPKGRPQDDAANEEQLEQFLHCISSLETKPCPMKTGEKASLTYSFEDPKEYAKLALAFGDVPPISLKVSTNEKPK